MEDGSHVGVLLYWSKMSTVGCASSGPDGHRLRTGFGSSRFPFEMGMVDMRNGYNTLGHLTSTEGMSSISAYWPIFIMLSLSLSSDAVLQDTPCGVCIVPFKPGAGLFLSEIYSLCVAAPLLRMRLLSRNLHWTSDIR